MTTGDAGLAKFQNENCKGCYHADDKKVGTGEPCCTKPTLPHTEDGVCIDRRTEPTGYDPKNN